MLLPAPDGHGVHPVGHVVGHRGVGIELRAVLVEVGDFQAGSPEDLAVAGLQFAQQELHQRRLAAPVGSDDADAVAAQHGGGEVADQGLAPVPEIDPAGAGHESSGGGRFLELQFDVAQSLATRPPLLAQAHVLKGRGQNPSPYREDVFGGENRSVFGF